MYTTIYNDYSQSDLLCLFGTSTWNSLSFEERMHACQEVENRYAAENNMQPFLVLTDPMTAPEDLGCYGYYNGNAIYLNESMVRDGVFTTTYTDENGNTQTRHTDVLAPSWNTLDTVYHEGTHGIQDIQGRMPDTYIRSDVEHDLYRIQAIEKEAYAVGQTRTLDALSMVEKTTGELDSARNEYIASVRADSFQEALQQASLNYNDENIEATLAAVINDREQGIQPENPSESYIAINELCDDYDIQRASEIQLRNEAREPNQTQEDSLFLDGSEAWQDTQTHEAAHAQQEALSNTESNYSTDYDDGYSAFSPESAQSQYDAQSLDDGFSNTASTSNSYSEDFDDGYSASGSADYSADSQSVSDGMDNSSDDGMSGGSDGGMDMD